jgi:hypothetical protein
MHPFHAAHGGQAGKSRDMARFFLGPTLLPNANGNGMHGFVCGAVGRVRQICGRAGARIRRHGNRACGPSLTYWPAAPHSPATTELLSAILTAEPSPLTDVLLGVPAPLEAILRKCLDKNMDRRIRSVAELALALVPWARPETAALISRIADPSRPFTRPAQGLAPFPGKHDRGTLTSINTGPGRQPRQGFRPKPASIFAAALAFSSILVVGAIWLARGSDTTPRAAAASVPVGMGSPPAAVAAGALMPAVVSTHADPSPALDESLRDPTFAGEQPAPTSVTPPARPTPPRSAPRKPPPLLTGPASPAKPTPDPQAPATTSAGRDLRSLIDERQ